MWSVSSMLTSPGALLACCVNSPARSGEDIQTLFSVIIHRHSLQSPPAPQPTLTSLACSLTHPAPQLTGTPRRLLDNVFSGTRRGQFCQLPGVEPVAARLPGLCNCAATHTSQGIHSYSVVCSIICSAVTGGCAVRTRLEWSGGATQPSYSSNLFYYKVNNVLLLITRFICKDISLAKAV